MDPLRIRSAVPADAVPVRELLVAAFNCALEVELVERLHGDGDMVLSLAGTGDGDAVIAYVGFARLVVEVADREISAIGLAPLAVAPALQRQGVGSRLVRQGLARLRECGEAIVFVLGDPAFYGRFGFDAGAARAFASVYAGPNFMALRLRPVAPLGGRVRYPAAFTALG
jgi:putative acetyltransferase